MKILAVIFTFFTFVSFGQDAKSDAILAKLSKKINATNSFYIEFSENTYNKDAGVNQNLFGKGWVKENKYYASLGDNTIISNGLKTWTVVKEEKTTYAADADEDDDELMNPKKLMTIWETGFKSKYIKEEALSDETVHKIYLYPKNPRSVDFTTIVVYVSKAKNELKKVIIKMKDATKKTYRLKKYTANPTVSDSKFVYNKAKFPGYKLIED
ncbi:MAG: outer membrane lipoprotein carrier protein LolA [Crocinitomicaceae bacterium]|nr:outer membrane lipoprotein carrier protein LolA [Crocinitomicaceae bacterium]|tara:strand:+ start:4580 stop:5215 length:636 start_codon:yes stop_codon:yes gene_type:complete